MIMTNEFTIREVRLADAARLAEIYSFYVLNTAVSFEYYAPTVEEFEDRIRQTVEKYPYLVCEADNKIVGYAYAGAYSARDAYAWTATASIYLDKDYRRHGIGTALYDALEKRLREMGIVNILAGVAYCENEDPYLSRDSYKFHLKMGYSPVARMKSVGKKFDRWYDLLWMQKKTNGARLKDKNPFRGLLLIPIMILVTVVVFAITLLIDAYLLPWDTESLGHPAPVFTLFAFIGMPFVNIGVCGFAIILTIIRLIRAKMKKRSVWRMTS